MANLYGIGQHRFQTSATYLGDVYNKNDVNTYIKYITPIDAESSSVQASFQDILLCPGGNSSEFTFDTNADYHLSLKIPQDDSYSYDFDLLLIGAGDNSDGLQKSTNSQYLRKIHVDQGSASLGVARDVVMYQKTTTSNGNTVKETKVDFLYETNNQEGKYPQLDNADPSQATQLILSGAKDESGQHFTDVTSDFNYVTLNETWNVNATEYYSTFDIIFRPVLSGKKYIALQMYRGIDDYKVRSSKPAGTGGGATSGRLIDITKVKFTVTKLKNILTSPIPSTLTRIGVWSHPGLLMAINGEEIRVGQSGYYELDTIPITSLSIYARSFAEDNFSIDYQYVSET